MKRFFALGSITSCLLLLAAVAGGQSDDVLREKRTLPSPGKSKVLKSQLIKVPAEQVPLQVPDGFRVGLFAEDLTMPREMELLPSGDVLVVESAAGRVRRLADRDGDGRAEISEEWASGLKRPYGIVYDGGFVYVGNTDSVVRFRVDAGEKAGSREDVIERLQFDGEDLFGSGHWTRDVLFSRDGSTLYVSVGSRSNNDAGEPAGRAAILAYTADGSRPRLFATGLRNPVSIALRPGSDDIWTTVNERDGLGNDLVPDYVTRVRPGGFYGWPYYYIGDHPDPRRQGERPDLAGKVIVPDVLIQSHSAPLGLDFYEGSQFPERYRNGLFVGMHGSWNRDPLVGYKVVFIPFRDGGPAGPPEDFLTGFIKSAETGEVLGRPVAPFVAADGSLLVSDDDGGRVWRIEYRKGVNGG
jgi:glucose/arabinose dehydrogenase